MTTRTPAFSFTELRQGWLDIRLEDGDKVCDFSVAAVFSEPLRDLCDALVDAHDAMNGGVPPYHFEFEWLGEGWMYFWKLRPEGDIINVSASFAGSRVVGDRPSVVWELDTTFDRNAFAREIWSMGGAILSKHGLVGYRQLWGRDFPLAQLLGLREIIEDTPMTGWDSELKALTALA